MAIRSSINSSIFIVALQTCCKLAERLLSPQGLAEQLDAVHLAFDTAPTVVAAPPSPDGAAQVLRGSQRFVAGDGAGTRCFPRLCVLAWRYDSGISGSDCLVALSGIVSSVGGDRCDALIELPANLPALYRDFFTNITSTLSDEGVAGRASDELHALLDQVIIRWNAETRSHEFEMRGDLLELIGKPQGKTLGGDADLESSLKLVAGAGIRRILPALSAVL